MQITLPFNVLGVKEIDGKLTKCVIKPGEAFEVDESEIKFYGDLYIKWEHSRIESEDKKRSEEEMKRTLNIRDLRRVMQFQREG